MGKQFDIAASSKGLLTRMNSKVIVMFCLLAVATTLSQAANFKRLTPLGEHPVPYCSISEATACASEVQAAYHDCVEALDIGKCISDILAASDCKKCICDILGVLC